MEREERQKGEKMEEEEDNKMRTLSLYSPGHLRARVSIFKGI